jgi:hypothetical protein
VKRYSQGNEREGRENLTAKEIERERMRRNKEKQWRKERRK